MTKSGKNIKHFIKFLPKLNNITLVKRLGDNWQRVVLDDITENGERIKFLPLLSTYDQSKSITLYGRKFCCKACVDRERNDTLFIFSVSDAALGGPQKSSKEIDGPWGDFCCQGGHVERTIPLPPQLLASKSQKACAEFIHPSAQLIDTFERHIRQIEIDLFDIAATERTESNIVLQECRKLWKDFELDKVVNVTIRQKRLLNELIISTERVEDVKELTERLSIPVLNAYVNKRGDDRFLELLHRIGRLPLPKENDLSLEKNNWKSAILTILRECAAREGADHFEDSVTSIRKTAENSNVAKATDEKSDGEKIVGAKETEPDEETYPGQCEFSKDDYRDTASRYFDADLQEQPCTSFLTEDAVRSEGCKDQDNDVSSAKHSGSEQPNTINIPVSGLIAPIDPTDLFLEKIHSEGETECQNCKYFRQCILASKAKEDLLNPEELTAVIDTIQLTPIICLKNIRILAINLLYHEDINRARLAVWHIERRKDFKVLLSKGEFLYNLYNIYQTAEWDPFTMFMFLIDEDDRIKSIKNFVNYVFTVNEDENKQKETYSFLRNEANKVMYGSQYKDCIESILVKIQIFTFSKTLQSRQDEVCKIKWKMARHYDSLHNPTKAQALINSAMLGDKSERAIHQLVSNLIALNDNTTTNHDYLEETKKFLQAFPARCLGVIKRIDALDGYRRLPEVFKKHPLDITEIKSIIMAICSAYDNTPQKYCNSLWDGMLISIWQKYLKPSRKEVNKRSDESITLTRLSLEMLLRIRRLEGESFFRSFMNLHDLYSILRLTRNLWEEYGGIELVRDIVYDCYEIGAKLFSSDHPFDVQKLKEHGREAYWFRYAFICQAFTEDIFKSVQIADFEKKLKDGIEFLSRALANSNSTYNDKHYQTLGRCYKGIADYANKCAHEKLAVEEYDEAERFFYDAITNYEEAIKNFERVIQAPDEAEIRSSTKVEVLMEQGDCYLSLGFINIKLENGIQKAHELWDKAKSKYLAAHHVRSPLTLPPHKTQIDPLLGKFADFYFTTHRPQNALPFYEEIMKHEKAYKKEDKNIFDLYSYRWGVALTFAAEHEQARDKFEETLSRDPSQGYLPLIYKQLVRTCRILKDKEGYNNAIDRARKTGIEISAPAFDITDDYSDLVFLDDDEALWFRVQFQQECEEYFRQGRFFKVIKDINKLFHVANQNHLSGYTNDPAILLNLGKSYRMVGDLNRAEENINKALYARATTKNRSYCMKALGDALLDRGEYEHAADYYSSTYELEGDCGSLLAAASVFVKQVVA